LLLWSKVSLSRLTKDCEGSALREILIMCKIKA
jgi:hypothetical protein